MQMLDGNTAALREYEAKQAEQDRQPDDTDARLILEALKLCKVRIGSIECGGGFILEALCEQEDLHRPLANLFHDAIEHAESLDKVEVDEAEVGKLVAASVMAYVRKCAAHKAA